MEAGQRSRFHVLAREDFSDAIFLLKDHPSVMARPAGPGQIAIVMCRGHGERISLKIAGCDRDKGFGTDESYSN